MYDVERDVRLKMKRLWDSAAALCYVLGLFFSAVTDGVLYVC